MGNKIAFALRADYEGTTTQVEKQGATPVEVPKFGGGLIAAGDDRDFNIAELLEKGNGVIELEESDVTGVNALDAYPALKRVPVPEPASRSRSRSSSSSDDDQA